MPVFAYLTSPPMLLIGGAMVVLILVAWNCWRDGRCTECGKPLTVHCLFGAWCSHCLARERSINKSVDN